jgi:hypothetical protein
MRIRVNSALRRRIEKIESRKQGSLRFSDYMTALVSGPQQLTKDQWKGLSAWQRAIALFPKITPIDEWDETATAQQAKLIDEARDLNPEPVVVGPDPHDVTHRYKPTATMHGTRIQMPS